MSFCQLYQNDTEKNKINPLQVPLPKNRAVKGKRISLSASRKGSMCVEASVILPIVLCALMGMIMWGKVLILDQEMQTALEETARQTARLEYILGKKGKEGTAVSMAAGIFLKARKQGNASDGILVSGISFAGSGYRKETKEIVLHMKYRIRLNTFLLGTWKIPIENRVVQKCWNGYCPSEGEDGRLLEYVYVTEDGNVYHTDPQCYHMHITIRETKDTEPYYQGKTGYRPCRYCIRKDQGRSDVLYIPEEGDCYHANPACQALTRTVRYIKKEDAGDRIPCSHCSR